jgi:hypothetical protein
MFSSTVLINNDELCERDTGRQRCGQFLKIRTPTTFLFYLINLSTGLVCKKTENIKVVFFGL